MTTNTALTSSRWEQTLTTWAKGPGETEKAKCENAVKAIRKAIAAHPQLSTMDITVDAHGSYPNRTNIAQESDVDIHIRRNMSYFYDLPPNTKPEDFGIIPGTLAYADYKNMVQEALESHFGKTNVTRGKKAFDIHENTNRIDADAVAAFGYRYYSAAGTLVTGPEYQPGFSFYPDAGEKIFNYPDQVYANGVAKHEATGKRYKKIIRILKNARNSMQGDRVPGAADVASTLIEGLVWNVPNNQFGSPTLYQDLQNALVAIYTGVKDDAGCQQWTEVNGIKYLFRPSQPWTRQKALDFILASYSFIGFK